MAYAVSLREDGWFDAGKDLDPKTAANIIYHSKQKLKKVLESVKPAHSIKKLKENLDCKISDASAVSLPGFDGRPYFEGKELRISPSSGMPEYCVLGKAVPKRA